MREDIARKLAKEYGGPIIFPYISWVLNQCIDAGVDTIYFVARDGYILKSIADIYICRNGLDINTKYIYGSRKVWRVGHFLDPKFDVAGFLEESYPDRITGSEALARLFMLDESEMEGFLPEYYRVNRNGWSISDVFVLQNFLNTNNFKKYLQNRHRDIGNRV